jgi:hypothetical protein
LLTAVIIWSQIALGVVIFAAVKQGSDVFDAIDAFVSKVLLNEDEGKGQLMNAMRDCKSMLIYCLI